MSTLSTGQFDRNLDLKRLAGRHFPDLTEAEIKLLDAVTVGNWACFGGCVDTCNPPSSAIDNPATNPKNAESWGGDRNVRSALIHWLCVAEVPKASVDLSNGIKIHAARIVGDVGLNFVHIPFPITFLDCYLPQGATFNQTEIPLLDLDGSRVLMLKAISADVRGDMNLSHGFVCESIVAISQAKIRGDLLFEHATIRGGIEALQIEVHGNLFLEDTFVGGVNLTSAYIDGILDCKRSKISQLDLHGATVKAALFCQDMQDPEGLILRLRNATVGTLYDDKASWPAPGNLDLDGFVYGPFVKDGLPGQTTPDDAESRLKWLALQKEEPFRPQPYLQLAKVMKESGDDNGAIMVLREMETLRRKHEDRATDKVENWISKEVIGYGYTPLRALGWMAGLWAIGWIIYRRGNLAGSMVPVDKEARKDFITSGEPSDHYVRFSPFIYSLENTLPLVKLGQVEKWQPDPHLDTSRVRRKSPSAQDRGAWKAPLRWLEAAANWTPAWLRPIITSPKFIRRFLWFQVLVGWLLATLFLAGLAGVVHRP